MRVPNSFGLSATQRILPDAVPEWNVSRSREIS
jgi:hypothetical protein